MTGTSVVGRPCINATHPPQPSVHNRHQAQRGAAFLIQRRLLAEGGGCRRKGLAAAFIQSCWKGNMLRTRWGGGRGERGQREERIATCIQSRWKGHVLKARCVWGGAVRGGEGREKGQGGRRGEARGPGCCFRQGTAAPSGTKLTSDPNTSPLLPKVFLRCAAHLSPSRPPSEACVPTGHYPPSELPPRRCRRPGACAVPTAPSWLSAGRPSGWRAVKARRAMGGAWRAVVAIQAV